MQYFDLTRCISENLPSHSTINGHENTWVEAVKTVDVCFSIHEAKATGTGQAGFQIHTRKRKVIP